MEVRGKKRMKNDFGSDRKTLRAKRLKESGGGWRVGRRVYKNRSGMACRGELHLLAPLRNRWASGIHRISKKNRNTNGQKHEKNFKVL